MKNTVFSCSPSLSWMLVLILNLLLIAPQIYAGDIQVTMDVKTNNKLALQAFGSPLLSKSSVDPLNQSVQGNEISQCQPYGRASGATGTASVEVKKNKPDWFSITLNADARAHGGHYRTCTTCVLNQCLGIKGNDTTGDVSAAATAVVTVAFDTEFRHPGDYLLNVSSIGQSASLSLTDGMGRSIDLRAKDGGPALLHGTPGAVYYLSITLPASAMNSGGCCEDKKTTGATVDVRLAKAPILYSGYEVGYIKGGAQTNGYKNVGVILLDGKVHCSGTVVGKHTVLTAAHCLHGYDKKQMKFILGANYQYPDSGGGPFSVSDAVYPDGTDHVFQFNPKTYEDDIGLLYLTSSDNFSVAPAELYQKMPTWDDILAKQMSLSFVGFGFNVIAGDFVGIGVKREGEWQINKVANRTVSFSVDGMNTCFGDSGGPAFVENNQHMFLAAVTSGGDDTCTKGIETRVDTYASWLAGRIK